MVERGPGWDPAAMVDVAGLRLPVPETLLVAAAFDDAVHLGSSPSGVAVRLSESFTVTEVVFGPRSAGLGPAELGHELTVCLERARRKALASVTARLAADHRYGPALLAATAPDGLPSPDGGEDGEDDEEPGSTHHLSDDRRVRVERRDDGVVVAVELALAEHDRPEDLTDQIRQAATRALTGDAPDPDRRLATAETALGRVLARLTELGRDLDRARRPD